MRTGLKRLIVAVLCAAIVFVAMTDGTAGPLNRVQATKKDDLKNQNEEDQERLDELDAQVDEMEGEQQGIEAEIASLGEQIAELMASISLLEDEIADKKQEIVQAQADLEEAQRIEDEQYEAMKQRIKAMYENGEINYIDALLSSSSMEELLNKADYIERVHAYDQKMFENYQAARQHVADVKETLEIEESELEAAQGELQEEMDGVEVARAELELISADYAAQINRAQQQAQVYRAQIKQRNAEIKQIEEAERKAAEEAARKKAEEEARKNGSAGENAASAKPTATVNKDEILAANGSAKGKEIAIYACGFVGNPYVPGGTSLTNGADCSGFTQSVFKAYGYSLPRTSYSQRSAGREVSYAEAEPGDIICYPGHVAIYIGNGKIVHASSVKTGIKISNALYRDIVCVRRIV
ncbi:MAG: NlpC/P60 family protein [Roseburia sp.]|nr:NlpC/P60 family protein [Roseburia sp.]